MTKIDEGVNWKINAKLSRILNSKAKTKQFDRMISSKMTFVLIPKPLKLMPKLPRYQSQSEMASKSTLFWGQLGLKALDSKVSEPPSKPR